MGKTRKDVFSSNVQPKRRVREARKIWHCDECGHSNPAHIVQCRHCGAYET